MRRIPVLVVGFLVLLLPLRLSAEPVAATVCDILSNPQRFDGETVRVTGQVVAGFEQFAVKGPGCSHTVDAIWLSYPNGTNGKAGPAALLRLQLGRNSTVYAASPNRTPITLKKNKDFELFDKLLSTPARTSGICLGCVKFMVTATLVGRLDGTQAGGLIRDSDGRVIHLGGFGNLNRYRARLVLEAVSDVTSQEIDYSKASAIASSETPSTVNLGWPTADDLKRAVDAFGAPGEDNGVNVGFGGANEVPKDDVPKSSANSPDGLIFNVAFDSDRLKKAEMSIALAHIGSHIAEMRDPAIQSLKPDAYGLEFRAWQTTALSAIANNSKTLILPGGYLIYSRFWPSSDLSKNANAGIASYLANQAGIAP